MLGNIKENDSIYVLDRRKRPVLHTGVVVEVKPPKTQFGQPAVPGNNFLPTFIEISVRVEGEIMNMQQIPCDKDLVENGGSWVVSNNSDAMCAYIDNMKRTSQARLDSRVADEEIVEACDEIMPRLNPALAKERERESAIEARFSRLEDMMQRLLERELSGKE